MSLQALKQGTSTLEMNLGISSPPDLLNAVNSLWQVAIQIPSMPPSAVKNESELRGIRDFFEVALKCYIKCADFTGIEQCFEILTNLYQDYSEILKDSEDQWKIWGLYLTYLLSYNKIEEFHSELESVPWNLYTDNKYIQFAVTLEQFFMEGNYQEVLSAKNHSPSSEFDFFVNRISDTIRFEIASSFEKAYQKLSVEGACQLLKLSNYSELAAFLQAYAERSGKDIWRIDNNELLIKSNEKKTHEIPKWQLINQALNYAIELERIV